jgi:hypothetical protein
MADSLKDQLADKVKERIAERKKEILEKSGIDVELLKSVGPITMQNLPYILWNNPNILPQGIRDKVLKGIQDFSTNIFIDILTGVAFNVVANKIYPALQKMPLPKRLPIRLTIFSLPFGGTYPMLQENMNTYISHAEFALKAVE